MRSAGVKIVIRFDREPAAAGTFLDSNNDTTIENLVDLVLTKDQANDNV